jgi:transposase
LQRPEELADSKFAAYCGLAPKLWQSGQMKTKNMKRKNYNRILKGTFYNIAFTAARVNKQAKEYYQKKINEGKHHRQALLCLARQYCRITYVMMKKNEAFHAINA